MVTQSWPLAVLLLLLAGCATNRIDWASHVGNYTFDQAVTEIGPPDKQARLGDGTMVAEWLTRRGYRHGFATTPYASGYPYGYCWPVYPSYVETYSPDYYLRLTFGPDGRLTAWKKLAR